MSMTDSPLAPGRVNQTNMAPSSISQPILPFKRTIQHPGPRPSPWHSLPRFLQTRDFLGGSLDPMLTVRPETALRLILRPDIRP